MEAAAPEPVLPAFPGSRFFVGNGLSGPSEKKAEVKQLGG
jgi:hypothetical protein